jgi:hypothetical protein
LKTQIDFKMSSKITHLDYDEANDSHDQYETIVTKAPEPDFD